MDIIKLLTACYLYTGMLFTTFISLLAIAMRKTEIFKYKMVFVLSTTLLWPWYIYETFVKRN
jgi:hypothetical protein